MDPQTAQQEGPVPSDSPTLSGGSKRMPLGPLNLDSAHGIPRKDVITRTTSSKEGADIQSHSRITHLPSSDSADGIPHADEFSITNSSNGPDIHSPTPGGIPRNDVTINVLVGARESTNKGPFFLDSAASHHASGARNRISELTPDKAGTRLKTAGGAIMWSHGSGRLMTKEYTFNDVHYVPGLDMNLVSIPVLVDLDYSVAFTRNNCTIMDDRTNTVVGKGIRGASGLFELDSLTVPLDRIGRVISTEALN